MRIGIITHRPETNYGGILQAYALQTVLERLGHTVTILLEEKRNDRHLPTSVIGHWKMVVKQSIKDKLYKNHAQYILFAHIADAAIRLNTDRFIRKHIHTSMRPLFKDYVAKDFDALIAGSDQIWRPCYVLNMYHDLTDAFLGFSHAWPDVRRIAYAASFGTDSWEYTPAQTTACQAHIAHFDAISVREENAVDLCRQHFQVNATHVADPVMLLTAQDYLQLVSEPTTFIPQQDGDLFSYILDPSEQKTAHIQQIAKSQGYRAFQVEDSKQTGQMAELYMVPPLELWLQGFHQAKFIITDSFHGCVLSIVFNKPFIVYANEIRGQSRILSLLRLFGLEERLIPIGSIVPSPLFLPLPISVSEKLEAFKTSSMDFLINSLNEAQVKQ